MKLLILLLLPCFANAQGLTPERVDKIKNATVRIITDSSIGTGFFINPDGNIVTCFHVIENAVRNNLKIKIQFNNGDTIDVKPIVSSQDERDDFVKYDYFILEPISIIKLKFSYLKLGRFSDAGEGQEVYTCGYPLGYEQQMMSKGMISTIYNEKNRPFFIVKTQKQYLYSIDRALLDLTSTRGNSGGAIIRIGKNISDDVVVGIAQFIVSPIAQYAEKLINENKSGIGKMSIIFVDSAKNVSLNDPFLTTVLFTETFKSSSIGVSGMISVDYLGKMVRARKL